MKNGSSVTSRASWNLHEDCEWRSIKSVLELTGSMEAALHQQRLGSYIKNGNREEQVSIKCMLEVTWKTVAA